MLQNRTFRTADLIRLPSRFEQNPECCCVYLKLASIEDSTSWMNDVTSVWLLMNNLEEDSFLVKLLKDGVDTEREFLYKTFPNQGNAQHVRINWRDVLQNEGAGCYSITVEAEISGIPVNFTWGNYQLLQFDEHSSHGQVRLRSKFDSKQSIEGIDFTGSNVIDDIRFKGFFGYRNPNTTVDNIFGFNRELSKVKREHLNSFTLESNPLEICYTKPILDLHLLSENEILASDYNFHNHDKGYKDFPCIVAEVGEPTYPRGSKKAIINATFNNKVQNERSYQ